MGGHFHPHRKARSAWKQFVKKREEKNGKLSGCAISIQIFLKFKFSCLATNAVRDVDWEPKSHHRVEEGWKEGWMVGEKMVRVKWKDGSRKMANDEQSLFELFTVHHMNIWLKSILIPTSSAVREPFIVDCFWWLPAYLPNSSWWWCYRGAPAAAAVAMVCCAKYEIKRSETRTGEEAEEAKPILGWVKGRRVEVAIIITSKAV